LQNVIDIGLANKDVETPAGRLVTLTGIWRQRMPLMEYSPLFRMGKHFK